MKVYLIYDFLTEYGGLERLMANHARMLEEEGFEVEILTCHIDKDVLKKMEFGDLKITNISSLKTPYESISLAACYLGINNLSKINGDLFISYSFPANFMIRKKKTKKINYLNHFPHFLYFTEKDKKEWASSTVGAKRTISVLLSWFFGSWLKKLDKHLVSQNDLCFTNSKFTKKGLDKLYGMNMVLSYPVLDPIFKPSRTRINEKFIFSSSRIIPAKKYEMLIESCSLMKNKIPLRISGQCDPIYKKKLEDLAEKFKVDLKFVGRLSTEDLVKHYSSAEVYAFPTPKFEFGLVPAESLACGTPIVVWGDGGGQSEQVEVGINGYLAKPYDLKDFAAKMDLIVDTKLKETNRKKIVKSSEKFSYNFLKKGFIEGVKKVL